MAHRVPVPTRESPHLGGLVPYDEIEPDGYFYFNTAIWQKPNADSGPHVKPHVVHDGYYPQSGHWQSSIAGPVKVKPVLDLDALIDELTAEHEEVLQT